MNKVRRKGLQNSMKDGYPLLSCLNESLVEANLSTYFMPLLLTQLPTFCKPCGLTIPAHMSRLSCLTDASLYT